MESQDFKQANATLGAGENPNTRPLRISLCKNAQMPNYQHGFLVSKWQMDDGEKSILLRKIKDVLEEVPEEDEEQSTTSELIDALANKIINAIPPVYLSCMHSMSPAMLLQLPEEIVFSSEFLQPDQEAADRANANRIKDN